MHVLIIEPSRIFQKKIASVFGEYGIKSTCARVGEEALTIAFKEQEQIELVCVAMYLKDMSGVDFCKKIRGKGGKFKRIPIAMITSEVNKDVLLGAMNAGVTQIISKSAIPDIVYYAYRFSSKHQKDYVGTILYVEESVPVANAIIKILEEKKYSVTHYKSAEEAIEDFFANEYDMVISDLILKGRMTGCDLTAKIRADGEYDEIPILIMSGNSDVSQRIEVLEIGANDFVSKPFVKEELLARTRNALKTKKLLERVKSQQSYLAELAMKDRLTGAYNRHYLTDRGADMIEEAQTSNEPLSLIFADIDHFKKINDEHGHSAGDDVLTAFGRMILSVLGTEDALIRFGGEEFIILTHRSLDDASDFAENLRLKLRDLKPHNLHVTASFGLTQMHNDVDDHDMLGQLIERADKALYASKRNGRDRVTVLH